MKKVFAVIFSALLAVSLASCSQPKSDVVSELSEVSVTPAESSTLSEEVSEVTNGPEESSKEDISSSVPDTSKEWSKVSEIPTVSEISQEQSLPNSQTNDSYPKQLIEKVVDVEKLGEKTKSAVTDVLEGDEVYMNVTGKITLFGGITSNFDVEIAKSDEGTMEKFTFGDRSMKVIQNSEGTYTIDDENKTASLTGGAYNPNNAEKISDTNENDIPNSVANQIISYFSSSFGLDSLKYEKSSSEKYEGKHYTFDEYTSDGYTIKVYFDENNPEYIVSTDKDNKTSVIEIHSLNTSPDSRIFQIPENYQIVSE